MDKCKEKDFLTAEEVMEILRVKKSACYNLLGSPDCPFPVVKIGRLIRVPSNAFFNWYNCFNDVQA